MKIIRLECENFKKLKAVEITPTGDLVVISGKNGAGKSSILDAIWAALGGAKHIQAEPIRKGQDKARIKLDLGELIVERRFTPKGSTLTVENAEGARFTSPQTMLDALLGALTFDPLAFVTQEPEERYAALRGLVALDIDLDQLEGLNRRDYDRRTEISREARARRAQADGLLVPEGLPESSVDTQALLDQIASAAKVNAEIETRRSRRAQAAIDVTVQRADVLERRAKIAAIREDADRLEQRAAEIEASADKTEKMLASAEALPAPIDVDGLRRELATAETVNRGIEQRARKTALLTEAIAAEQDARALTDAMAARDQAKAAALARAEMPVPGLAFGDGAVTFEGIPFEQASSAEQLRVSIAIAMAANPRLRVLRIKEGSLLDADNLALIAEMAHARDYAVWIERVDSSGKVGIYIEDGSIVAVDGEPVAASS